MNQTNTSIGVGIFNAFIFNMKYLFLVFLNFQLSVNSLVFAQYNHQGKHNIQQKIILQNDKGTHATWFKYRGLQKVIAIPLLLTSAGLYSLTNNDLLNKYEIQEERNEWTPTFHSHADNYLQYAPIAAVYALNMAGVKGKNDFANRTAILIKSEILIGILTYSLKKITAVPRPDTGQPTSFPSGHTAQAFAAATFMAKEFGHKSIWYSIGAYTLATGVGAMRVLNNRHWVSDVLVGAGIGIFSTNIAYLTHQYKWGKKKRYGQTILVPSYDGHAGMVNVIHRFS